ncbi:MAG: hypothetical protein GVY07_15655 [Bacteroidetes bacterium]|nr:hypothetical protein [Bacteroidota bacterium]
MKKYKTYYIRPKQYKTLKPRFTRLRNMILLALGFLLFCVLVAYFQEQMDLIRTPWILTGMLIFNLVIFIPFEFRQERINKRMHELQRNSNTAEAKKREVKSSIWNLFFTKGGKNYHVTYSFKDQNGNNHLVTGSYRISRKELIPETATVVYNPHDIAVNLVLKGEPHEFEWLI